MNDCARLSDRMPEVALERSVWTPDEAAHLDECEECGDEWRLMLATHSLAGRAPAISDPAALAAAVQGRIARDRAERIRTRRTWSFVGAAAAAAMVLGVALADRGSTPPPAARVAAGSVLVPLPELEGLETAQLDTLLQSIDRPAPVPSSLEASTMGEHEDGELEQVFAIWEG
jgi:3-oxoacyl-(acyl-carrier-protein) synthase